MDTEYAFKNNVTMSKISVKKTVLQKNSAFGELYAWEYLSIHDV
jgi:hypothetical protein